MADVETRKNESESRYEAWIGDEIAGFAEYQLSERAIRFTHTEVGDEFEGRGVGSTLVRAALDDARRDESRKIIVLCPFIKDWIGRHRDYQDLLA